MDDTFDRMTLSDLDAVLEIEKASFTQPWTREMFENEILKNPFSEQTLLRVGGELAGYVSVWYMFEECHILDLAVAPGFRRQGWGEKIIREVIEKGRQKEVKKILLEVRESNQPARALYRKLGFLEISIRKNYYANPPENALILQRV